MPSTSLVRAWLSSITVCLVTSGCLNSSSYGFAGSSPATNSIEGAHALSDNTLRKGLYTGTIGGDAITACLMTAAEPDDSEFYENKIGKTMNLATLPDDPHRLLQSEYSHMRFAEDFDANTDVWWQIDWHGEKISGLRHIPSGPDQRIALIWQGIDCKPGYEAKRLDIAAVAVRDEAKDGVVFKITTHPVSNLTGTLIGSGLDANATSRINSASVNSLRAMNKDWITCTDYDGSLLPLFVTSRWLAVEEKDSRYCGGMHPFYESSVLSFDTKTGRENRLRGLDRQPIFQIRYVQRRAMDVHRRRHAHARRFRRVRTARASIPRR